jgi:hypothetical protein
MAPEEIKLNAGRNLTYCIYKIGIYACNRNKGFRS